MCLCVYGYVHVYCTHSILVDVYELTELNFLCTQRNVYAALKRVDDIIDLKVSVMNTLNLIVPKINDLT